MECRTIKRVRKHKAPCRTDPPSPFRNAAEDGDETQSLRTWPPAVKAAATAAEAMVR